MADDFQTAYALSLRYLALQARTCFEMKQYLGKKGFHPDIVQEVLDRLLDLGYLNDRSFAAQFIDARLRFKPKSKYALAYELKAKGIDAHLAQTLLEEQDDLAIALGAVRSRQAQWQGMDPESRKKKVMNYLRYRGFGHGVCQTVWEKLFANC